LRLTTSLPSVSRLSRQCGILNISQPNEPPRSVTGTALLFFFLLHIDIYIERESERERAAQGRCSKNATLYYSVQQDSAIQHEYRKVSLWLLAVSNIATELRGNLALRALLVTCLKLVSCLVHSFTLKTEAACSSETCVEFQQTTRRYIPEDRTW
jgi:hypothetical protein